METKSASCECYIGADYGCATLKLGLVSPQGGVTRVREYPSSGGAVRTLENAIDDYLSRWGSVPRAVGLGLVGRLDTERGVWVHSLNMNICDPFPIAQHLKERFGLPIFIDNDVHAATIAEKLFGVGRVTGHFILVSAGAGIGAGIVTDGRLVRGVGNAAGEIGHMCVAPNGPRCTCGQRGCLETLAGERSLIERALLERELHPDSLLCGVPDESFSTADLFRAAEQNDPAALSVAESAVSALGCAVVNLINTLNPEHVVLTGSVARNNWFFEHVRDCVYQNAYITSLRCLAGFSLSQTAGEHVGICGAGTLCMESNKKGGDAT